MTLFGTTCSVKSEGAKTAQTGHTALDFRYPKPVIGEVHETTLSEQSRIIFNARLLQMNA